MRHRPRVAVVGHVEWVDFVRVARVPKPGEVVHAAASWQDAGGSGAVAAVQLAKLAGEAEFFTAFAADDLGRQARERLEDEGVRTHVAWRSAPQRRAFVYLDARHERTITTLGERLEPSGSDPLPWRHLERCDAVYFTAGDLAALRHARRAATVVATPRASRALARSGVVVDALVHSAKDSGERPEIDGLDGAAAAVVATAGGEGGRWRTSAGAVGSWDAVGPPGPYLDAYGAGDSFAGGLTFGLANGRTIDEAVALGARCGAWKLAGHAPYGNQLTGADLAG
jgi:ribokinase